MSAAIPLNASRHAIATQSGANRQADDHCQIPAGNDLEAIAAWLLNYADRPRTYANYRKECMRLIVFSTDVLQKPMSGLDYVDFQRFFQSFLPNPPDIYIGHRKEGWGSPEWRPFFRQGLRAHSIQQARLVINALFSWLVTCRYLRGNPVGLMRARTRARKEISTHRVFSRGEFASIMQGINVLPQNTAHQERFRERALWLMSLLYLSGMRISEVVENSMDCLRRFEDAAGVRRMFCIVGKGGQYREIPATDEVIAAMRRYRISEGLPATPAPGEGIPFLIKQGRPRERMRRQQIHNILTKALTMAAERAPEEHRAALRAASAHWLRHTFATEIVNSGVDLRYAQDVLGHKDINTTMLYQHETTQSAYDEIAARHRLPNTK